jgi:thiol-disulfide isomerase/thioredoxin
MSFLHDSSTTELLVACLCAEWCGTCNEYRPLFERLRAEFPAASFAWIDVEDQSELVDPLEIENFPTLLIAQGAHARFLGTVMPHAETLRRLVASAGAADAAALKDPQAHALVQRLRAA